MTACVLEHPDKIKRDAVLERGLRLQLLRYWVDEPKRWAAWLMQNPSDADDKKDDRTMRRVIHFTYHWGYDGCIVVNLYPLVGGNSPDFWAKWSENGRDWHSGSDMQRNLSEIENAGRRSCLRVVAFGGKAATKDPDWIEKCVERFEQPYEQPRSGWKYQESLVCLGNTRKLQPIHPMARGKSRVSDDAKHVIWREK